MAKADLKLTVGEYLTFQAASVLVAFLLGWIIFRQPLLGLVTGFGGYLVPGFYVKLKQRSRLGQFNGQLGDALAMLANSLRTGYSMAQSMDLVAREGRPPLAEEFTRVNKEVALGLSPEEALGNLVKRIDSEDLDLVVTAINVQREVGGNLAEILDTIAHTIRERVKLKGDIKALTAQAEYSSYVVASLPVALGLILWLINRQYMMKLMQDVCGWAILGCSAVMIVAGFFAMRKVAKVEI
jgi:tight adherence protein B